LGVFLLSASLCSAATYTFTGAVNSDWFNQNNWNPVGVPAATDTVNVNGTVNFTAPVVFSGQFNWTGGTLTGNGLTITNGGVLTIAGSGGSGEVVLLTAITNFGTVNWTNGHIQVNASGNSAGGPLINQAGGVWYVPGGYGLSDVYSTAADVFQNSGTIAKPPGGNTDFGLPIINSGMITNTGGVLNFNSGGTLGGSFEAAAPGTIYFNGGVFTLSNSDPLSSGSGLVQFTSTSSVTFSSAITNFTFAAGTLVGSNYVAGTFNWVGGNATSITGPLSVASGGTVNLNSATAMYLYSALTNAGTVNWLRGDMFVNYSGTGGSTAGGPIVNLPGAHWEIQCDQALNNSYSTSTAYFQNAGIIDKFGGIGSGQTTIFIPFYNTGTVNEETETLNFNGGGLLGGTFSVPLAATLNFNAGTFTLTNGTLATNGLGTVQFGGGAAVTFSGAISNFSFSGVTLTGSNYVGGTLNWSGGTASGPLIIGTNGVLNISGTIYMLSSMTNAGTVNWLGGTIYLDESGGTYYDPYPNAGPIVNLAGGIWNIQCDQALAKYAYNQYYATVGPNSYFQNAGTVEKTAATGTTAIEIPFSNTGTFNAQRGTLNFNAGGNLGSTFSAAAGTSIWFSGGNFTNAGPVLTGSGGFQLVAGSLTLLNDVISNLQFAGGTITLSPSFQAGTITNLALAGAALNGSYTVSGTFNCGGGVSGNLTVTNGGILNWSGGNISGSLLAGNGAVVNWSGGTSSGPLIVGTNGTLNISGTVNLLSSMTNAGTVNWLGGTIYLDESGGTYYDPYPNAGPIVNLAGGIWNIQCDQALAKYAYNQYYATVGPNSYFQNAGTVEKTAATGTTAIEIPFNNTGTVNAQSGTLTFSSGLTNTAGMLDFGINGGSAYGQMTISGAASLAGIVNVNFNNGYAPPVNTPFPLLSYGSASGQFTVVNLPRSYIWRATYGSTVFTVIPTNAVTAPSITASPSNVVESATYGATFTVGVAGTPPFFYQWQLNGGNLTGANNPALILTNLTSAMSGSYQVIVTNVAGSVTSAVATLNVTPPLSMVTYAGLAGFSWTNDGPANLARFNYPYGVAVDGSGNVYIADLTNDTIRVISTAGQVRMLAGSPGNPGSQDGLGSGAQFNGPSGVAVDGFGNVFVADQYNETIRKVTAQGVVTTVAGLAGVVGSVDGNGPGARFNSPAGLALDAAGNLYVADTGNDSIRKVTQAGVVTTFAGLAGIPGSLDAVGTNARFSSPVGLALDSSGVLYVADSGNNTIRKIIPNGTVSTLAGNPGLPGSADGLGSAAQFASPIGVALDTNNNIFVTDFLNHSLRRVTPSGLVRTMAGLPGTRGSADGLGSFARFDFPAGIAIDSANNFYIADAVNNTIRRGVFGPAITSQPQSQSVAVGGNATFTVAAGGMAPLSYQWQLNGFNIPGATGPALAVNNAHNASAGSYTVTVANVGNTVTSSVATLAVTYAPGAPIDPALLAPLQNQTVVGGGNVLFSVSAGGTQPFSYQWFFNGAPISGASNSFLNLTTVSILAAGNYSVVVSNAGGAVTSAPVALTVNSPLAITTFAGAPGVQATNDGPGIYARFNDPLADAVDSAGNIYVADTDNDTIRLITPAGIVSTLAGTAGMAVSQDGYGTGALFNAPAAITLDHLGNVFVADTGSGNIRKIIPAGGLNVVSTIATGFDDPVGLAVDAVGNVYVADHNALTISKISPSGSVNLFAGFSFASGVADGIGNGARFAGPRALAFDAGGNLYVGDDVACTIRLITPTGVVTTVAGSPGHPGFQDGVGAAALFNGPAGLAFDNAGNIYVTDEDPSFAIRKLTLSGTNWIVSTPAGGSYGLNDGIGSLAQFNNPTGIAVDGIGNVYIVDRDNQSIRKGVTIPLILSQPQSQTANAGNSAAFSVNAIGTPPLSYQWQFNGFNLAGSTNTSLSLAGVRNSAAGSYTVLVANSGTTVTSVVATLTVLYPPGAPVDPAFTAPLQNDSVSAGSSPYLSVGVTGSPPFSFQWWYNGTNLVTGATNGYLTFTNVQVGSSGSYTVVVSNAAGSITSTPSALSVNLPLTFFTLAGGSPGTNDGLGGAANFGQPTGVAVDSAGNVYVADNTNCTIRKITPGGAVTTLAGLPGIAGSADGMGSAARFNNPVGVAVDAAGTIYVADTGNDTLRKITPGGTVTTLAGTVGVSGGADGPPGAALFNQPAALALDAASSIYVADTASHTIRKVTPAGTVTTLAGSYGNSGKPDGVGAAARFYFPSGIAVDVLGNIYVADDANSDIRKLTPDGLVITLAGNPGEGGFADGAGAAALFSSPVGIAVDRPGNVYVGDSGNHVIRAVSPAGVVTTPAGRFPGTANGTGSAAQFDYPHGVAMDSQGNVYVADTGNNAIRKGGFFPSFILPPRDRILAAGTNFILTTSLAGTLPLSYQWLYNGSWITGATNPTLAFTNMQLANAGSYSVVATNLYGSNTSSAALLTVLQPPAFVVQPQNGLAVTGENVAFSATVSGDNLSYQWQFDGTNLPGATSLLLTLPGVTAAQVGSYDLIISNLTGSATSSVVTLSVAAGGTLVTANNINSVWTAANSPYLVGANFAVANLTIQPGVAVLFNGPYGLTVTGSLRAVGTAASPITFSGATTATPWQGISFVSANSNSALAWCVIRGSAAGGLRFTNTPFALTNCVIDSNTGVSGGGIYTDSPLFLQNCTLINNAATFGQQTSPYFVQGGALFSASGNVTLQSCIVSNNSAVMPNIGNIVETSTGGGIDCEAGSLTLNNCTIVNNTTSGAGLSATSLGGGVFLNAAAALTASGSVFTGNIAGGGFGGAASAGNAGYLACLFNSNRATYGGAIYTSGAGQAAATNCLFTANSAAQGGAVYSTAGQAAGDFENCTLTQNSPDAFNGYTGLIHDSILYSDGVEIVLGSATNPVVAYSDVQGGYSGPGGNNQNVNPGFVSASNFLLSDSSPLVDAGDPAPQFNDAALPPSQGGDQNDLGAYGGPGAAYWPAFASIAPVVLVNGQPAAPFQTFVFNVLTPPTITFSSGYPGGHFEYTLDGSNPFDSDFLLDQVPLLLTNSAEIRLLAWDAAYFSNTIAAPVTVRVVPGYSLTAAAVGGLAVGGVIPSSGVFLSNAPVTLTATNAPGWAFLHWTNGVSGTNNPITVAVNGPLNAQAVFGTALSAVASGSGSVQANPALPLYPYGSTVQLTALPANTNFYFRLWGGAALGDTVSPLDFVVTNANPGISAVFSGLPSTSRALNLAIIGNGDVTRSPQASNYPPGTIVTLNATPAAGYAFTDWAGGASGSSNPLQVTLNSDVTVTAVFSSTNTPPGPPLVAITNPIPGASFILPTNVAIYPSVHDTNSGGSVSQVVFFNNGTNQIGLVTNSPFAFSWTNPPVGTNFLAAVAYNNLGLSATSTVVNLTVTQPPPQPASFTLGNSIYSVLENAGSVTITVQKNANTLGGVVDYSTVDGTALAGAPGIGNYQAVSGSLTFNSNDTSQTIAIPIVANTIYEGNTSFGIFLSSSGDGSSVGSPSSAVVTIIDVNQPAPGNSFLLRAFPQPAPAATSQLMVNLIPSQAGGQWRFPWDLSWRANGQTVANLPADNYPLEFRQVPGYLPYPPALSVAVTNGGTTAITNQYLPAPTPAGSATGTLTVNIGPNAPSGAAWQIYGISGSQPPGATVTNLLPDTYYITFAPVGGYSPPAELAIPIAPAQSETVTVNYQLSATPPSAAALPGLVPSSDISDLRDFPYGYNGQLQTDVGYGSGVVVRQNIVLTAAHMVFNDQTLSYVSQAYWSFEQEGATFGPDPLPSRGWYILSGYAAQRLNDLTNGYAPDQSSPTSQNLDVAALYFLNPAGRGGYGGYLASDAVPNQWLTSLQLKMLAGYPVDGSSFGQTVQPGQMYSTAPVSSLFTQQGSQTYVTGALLSYPGNSGGPLYVQFTNGTYYPAAVYLGTIGNGQGSQTVVRAIDSAVVNMITAAAALGDSGTNNSGGGVITIIPNVNVSSHNPGYLILQLGPAAAVQAGAAWELVGQPPSYYSASNPSLQEITSTNALALQFRQIPGWILPSNRSVTVFPGVIVTNVASYTVTNPALSVDLARGLSLSGTTNTRYQIQSNSSLAGTWTPFQTNTLTNFNFNLITNHPRPGFYRALWLTNSP
jgi:sugar lactone lactonase YvrE